MSAGSDRGPSHHPTRMFLVTREQLAFYFSPVELRRETLSKYYRDSAKLKQFMEFVWKNPTGARLADMRVRERPLARTAYKKLCAAANRYSDTHLHHDALRDDHGQLYPAFVVSGDPNRTIVLIWQQRGMKAPSISAVQDPAYWANAKRLKDAPSSPPSDSSPSEQVKTAPADSVKSNGRIRPRLNSLRKASSPADSSAASKAQPRISKSLQTKIALLRNVPHIRAAIRQVLMPSAFPRFMSMAGDLVANPVWGHRSSRERHRLAREYAPSGLCPPRIMHLDLLLLRCDASDGSGMLYHYFSPKWGYLLPFRERKPEDPADSRLELDADHLAKFLSGPAELFEVKPLSSKYVVSAKPHMESGDLVLYVFEFCHVHFRGTAAEAPTAFVERAHGGDRTPGRWLSLHELRSDPAALRANGDVIHSITQLFTVTLGTMPLSVPSGFPCDKAIARPL